MERGFTLIEILMVIMLVGIISAVAVPQFVDFSKDAKKGVTMNRLNEIRTALVGDPRVVVDGKFVSPGFINQVGSVPNALTDLTTQGTYPAYSPFTQQGWRGPYVSTSDPNWNKDAWGTVLQYNKTSRTLTSCGADKTCGTTDDLVVNF